MLKTTISASLFDAALSRLVVVSLIDSSHSTPLTGVPNAVNGPLLKMYLKSSKHLLPYCIYIARFD